MEPSTLNFSTNIPVRKEVDIFIAGGGPAGVAAGVTAARQGQSVFLAEGHTCFGGMGTAALVPVFLYFTDGVHFLAAGIGEEIYHSMRSRTHLYLDNAASVVNINSETLKRVYDDLVLESGLDFSFQTRIIGLQMDGKRATHAICSAKSGLFAVKARVFVDATGDGDLAAWAGAPFEKGDISGQMMPGSLCSLWGDIQWEQAHKTAISQGHFLETAFADGVFSIHDLHLPGIFQVGKHVGCGNLVHTFGVDSTDEASVTRALVQARKTMSEYEHYYKNYLTGFENMELVTTGALLGIRESRRILGDYVLNVEDFKNRAVFPDEIGRYCYPVDVHPAVPNKDTYAQFDQEYRRQYVYKKGESYGIPYRCLTPQGLDNILVAGRCISVDRIILGSIRVMPGCYITGQAAGMAASLAAKNNITTREVNIGQLQNSLKRIGAYVPNAAAAEA
jgi:hypothetical protein